MSPHFRSFALNIYLVKFLVKLVELSCLAHLFLVHEERRLNLFEPAFSKEIESV